MATRAFASAMAAATLWAVILKDVSHAAPLQDPDGSSRAMIAFLDGR